MQNIPSGNRELRLLFRASTKHTKEVEMFNNSYELDQYLEVETKRGWLDSTRLLVGDTLVSTNEIVKGITRKDENTYLIYV